MIHSILKILSIRTRRCLIFTMCMVCMVLSLSGCALMGNKPSAQLPDDIPAAWTADVAIDKLPISAGLLDLIDEEILKELVREAIENNPNLKATALRLKAAGYMLSGPRSKLLPQVSAEFSKARNNQGVNVETGEKTTGNSHRLSLGISWEIDIWGRLADEYAAAKLDFYSREYDYLHARDALAVRVIRTWLEQVAARRSLAIEKDRVEILRRIETILMERYKSGIGNPDELSTAKSRTEIARADLTVQESTLLRTIRKLEVLLGRYPRGELLSETRCTP